MGGASSSGPSWLGFLLGLVAFLGSAAAYGVDLLTGADVARSLAVNGAAALLLVAWAAHDTLGDPESGVRTLPGALGTALLLVGAYLLGAAVVVALTSPWHDRLGLALPLAATAAVAAVLGFAVFPVEAVLEDESGDHP